MLRLSAVLLLYHVNPDPIPSLPQNQLKELSAENSCGGAIYSAHSDLMDEETQLH